MQFQLDISIDASGLQKIYNASQSVTLVRVVQEAVPGYSKAPAFSTSAFLPVAWVVFQPLESNCVTWAEQYSLYATTSPPEPGAIIVMNAATASPAQAGCVYTFGQGQFTGASGSGSAYHIFNQTSSGNYNFGLAQAATVNGVSMAPAALDSLPVLFNEEASFSPQGEVYVFLSSYGSNGTFLDMIPANALSISLTNQNSAASIGFNDATNTFYVTAAPA